MCYLGNKEYKKRLDTRVRDLSEQIGANVEWTQKDQIAQCGRPDVL